MPASSSAPSVAVRPVMGTASTEVKCRRFEVVAGTSQGESRACRVWLCSTAGRRGAGSQKSGYGNARGQVSREP